MLVKELVLYQGEIILILLPIKYDITSCLTRHLDMILCLTTHLDKISCFTKSCLEEILFITRNFEEILLLTRRDLVFNVTSRHHLCLTRHLDVISRVTMRRPTRIYWEIIVTGYKISKHCIFSMSISKGTTFFVNKNVKVIRFYHLEYVWKVNSIFS